MVLVQENLGCGYDLTKDYISINTDYEVKYQDVVVCILEKKNKILISTRPYPKIFHGHLNFLVEKYFGEFY